jgi:Caspase domain
MKTGGLLRVRRAEGKPMSSTVPRPDRRHFVGLTASLPLWALARSAAPRVAVVIGNAAYAVGPLANPGKDAAAMASLLREMGFQVVLVQDAAKARMQAALDEARRLLQGRQGTGLFYYAGHGLQLDWRNYLLPVDAELRQAADVPAQALDVQAVLEAFKGAGTVMNILVLDACRDNPFGPSGSALASAKGLAPLDAPPGTFFAYATAPGNVAEDGTAQDGNGLYTRFLLQEMKRPEARIEDVFKRVRLQVRQASSGRQIPWESTSLEQDFVFATGQRSEAATGFRREREFDAEKAEWDRIRNSTRPEDIYNFLQRHPNGRIAEIAQLRLDQLAQPVVQATPTVPTLPAGVDRFRVGDVREFDVIDRLRGGEPQRVRREVTAIRDGQVFINEGEAIYTQAGVVLFNRTGRKDPGVLLAPSELAVGKRWRSAFTNVRVPDAPPARNFYEHRVVALEELQVPAGRYKAYRIEAVGESIGPSHATRLRNTIWIDPATMTAVRNELRHSSYNGASLTDHIEEVLVSSRLVPRA